MLIIHVFSFFFFKQGLSFFALILIASKLYNISKEVNFLQYVSNEWLPKQNLSLTSSKQTSQAFHLENLRQDIELLISELISRPWYHVMAN